MNNDIKFINYWRNTIVDNIWTMILNSSTTGEVP